MDGYYSALLKGGLSELNFRKSGRQKRVDCESWIDSLTLAIGLLPRIAGGWGHRIGAESGFD